MSVNQKKMTMGLIVGNRGFFPDHLAQSGREAMLCAIEKAGMSAVALAPDESKYGAVETRDESRLCAELFARNRTRIDGVIVTLPNFGEERAIADALRMADLRVPVLVQATPDDPLKMTIASRRDSFCGKMSACNNLRQYGIPYSLTTLHTESPDSAEFARDLEWFAAVCRVVRGFRNLRIGAIGARPAAFNTVRYSEKILESQGISIETLDLSEVLGRIERMKDNDEWAQT
jgi:L-fucose isomerase-like protein